jgi:hypothetical protein
LHGYNARVYNTFYRTSCIVHTQYCFKRNLSVIPPLHYTSSALYSALHLCGTTLSALHSLHCALHCTLSNSVILHCTLCTAALCTALHCTFVPYFLCTVTLLHCACCSFHCIYYTTLTYTDCMLKRRTKTHTKTPTTFLSL